MEAPPAKKTRVHFGSFEEHEKKKLEQGGGSSVTENGGPSAAILAGIKAGNINVADGRWALFGHNQQPACSRHPMQIHIIMLLYANTELRQTLLFMLML